MVRDVLPTDRDKSAETVGSPNGLTDSILISGHSQGGYSASLVSMWLEKADGVKYDTTTFAGVGASCAGRARLYNSGCDLTTDVDAGVSHSQIRDYIDIFDIYGGGKF